MLNDGAQSVRTPSNKTGKSPSPNKSGKTAVPATAPVWRYTGADADVAKSLRRSPEFLYDAVLALKAAPVPSDVWTTLLQIVTSSTTTVDTDRIFLSRILIPILSCFSTNIGTHFLCLQCELFCLAFHILAK